MGLQCTCTNWSACLFNVIIGLFCVAGEFPIDLTKLEVERDHRSVLNTADIESLKK